jgi:hypothetical protein
MIELEEIASIKRKARMADNIMHSNKKQIGSSQLMLDEEEN